MLAPLAAVLLFLAAIVSAFGYLRLEEMDREQEAVKRDVEYAQQRVRLRLLERQEQLMRLARDISNKEVDPEEFMGRSEAMVIQYPELQALTWIDARRRVKSTYSAPSVATQQQRTAGDTLRPGETENIYSLARDLQQPVYSQPAATGEASGLLQLHVPLSEQGHFAGVILGCATACRPRYRPNTPSPCSMASRACWPAPPPPRARRVRSSCPGPASRSNTKCRSRRWAMA